MSEDSFSEESDDCPDERILPETDEVVIVGSDEDLECDEPVPQYVEFISDRDCSTSSISSAKKRKASENGKVKNRKRSINMINWNSKRTFQ